MFKKGCEGYWKGKKNLKISGANHYCAKPLEHYEQTPVQRASFQTACKNRGWNYYDFLEIISGSKCGSRQKYYYIKIK